MPYVNVKVVRQQINAETKQQLIDGIMDIIVNIMGRDRNFTVITVDEVDSSNWYIGGQSVLETGQSHESLIYLEIKISKGTSNQEQMLNVIQAGKSLMNKIFGNGDITNYIVINELNPDGWGFDGISMTERNLLEQNK